MCVCVCFVSLVCNIFNVKCICIEFHCTFYITLRASSAPQHDNDNDIENYKFSSSMFAHCSGSGDALKDSDKQRFKSQALNHSHTLIELGYLKLLSAHNEHAARGSQHGSCVLRGLLQLLRGHAAAGGFSTLAAPSASKELW